MFSGIGFFGGFFIINNGVFFFWVRSGSGRVGSVALGWVGLGGGDISGVSTIKQQQQQTGTTNEKRGVFIHGMGRGGFYAAISFFRLWAGNEIKWCFWAKKGGRCLVFCWDVLGWVVVCVGGGFLLSF